MSFSYEDGQAISCFLGLAFLIVRTKAFFTFHRLNKDVTLLSTIGWTSLFVVLGLIMVLFSSFFSWLSVLFQVASLIESNMVGSLPGSVLLRDFLSKKK